MNIFTKVLQIKKPKFSGLKLIFKGQQDNALFGSYFGEKKRIKQLDDFYQCRISLNYTIYLLIKKKDDRVEINYSNNLDDGYKKCFTISLPQQKLNSIYPLLYGQSSKNSKFSTLISTLNFNTDYPNQQLKINQSKNNDYLPILFSDIAYIKKNQQHLEDQKDQFQEKNIQNIYNRQEQIFDQIFQASQFLGQCLSHSQPLIDFVKNNKTQNENFTNSLLQQINNWQKQSHQQFLDMRDETDLIVQELKNFQLDDLLQHTQEITQYISEKINEQKDLKLDQFLNLGKQIKNQIKKIKNKKQQPDQDYINAQLNKDNKLSDTLNITFVTLIFLLGLIVIIILNLILLRLNKQRNNFFNQF